MAAWDIKGRDALSATALGGTAGANSPFVQGDWTVNVAGSGLAMQGAAGGGGGMGGAGSGLAMGPLIVAAVVVGAAWLLLRRK